MQVSDQSSGQSSNQRQPPVLKEGSVRFDHFEAVLHSVKAELANDHFSAGFGKFREAVNLSRGFAALEDRAASLAVEHARQWLPEYWRLAKSLLVEAAETHSQVACAHELWDTINQQEQEANTQRAARVANAAGQNAFIQPEAAEIVVASKTALSASVLTQPAEVTVHTTPLNEFKLNNKTKSIEANRAISAPLLMLVAMLVAAASLFSWMHFLPQPKVDMAASTRLTQPLPIAKVSKELDADHLAWSQVNLNDPGSVEHYLDQFPHGVNRPLAVKALVEYRLAESRTPVDSTRVR